MASLEIANTSTLVSHASVSEAKLKDGDTQTQPIRTVASLQAQIFRHVHPVLLISFCLISFDALVADPVSTMLNSLPVVVAIQAAYAIVCLPAVGSQVAKPAKKLRPGEKRKPGLEAHTGPNIAVTTLVALILSVIATLGLHVVLVLFGAPLLTHIPHTLLCSTYLAVLGLFPLLYTRGVSGRDWLEILSVRAPLDEAFGGLIGACVGAWLGAVPIPLDWDREWQKWPVTIVCGIYAGYLTGKLLGGTVAFGSRLG
ncbi:GPI biosynthesis protein family Pig-F-domain-containing protein [Hypoxylon fragiforme]|uniref:GPI biosynthesis protein family Pig-F-domain-containing protein n=1 Tax=Hypoxylon fragiforme TaxID=63214 RepID=UPI0020C60F36|nr:GPI biosynthesis protein family Pig-F-domain-containing protein [Hypoxylon fragiforme]KAI2605795.1 GPI biosynthesis protein family Pig-F-domain-containing protein [Hypoxylon fragiforme]